MTFFAMFGTLFLFTQYMQFVLDYSPLASGVRFIPMAVVTMVVAPSSARIVEKVGTKAVVAPGLLFTSIALALGTFLTADGGYLPLLGVLLVMSVGIGLPMAPATESIMGSLPLAKAGVAPRSTTPPGRWVAPWGLPCWAVCWHRATAPRWPTSWPVSPSPHVV